MRGKELTPSGPAKNNNNLIQRIILPFLGGTKGVSSSPQLTHPSLTYYALTICCVLFYDNELLQKN